MILYSGRFNSGIGNSTFDCGIDTCMGSGLLCVFIGFIGLVSMFVSVSVESYNFLICLRD